MIGAGLRTTRALRALGLESAVAERASLIPHQRLCDHRDRLLADIDRTALWRDVGPCLALHHADLHEVLASHGDPIPVRRGVSLQQLSQQDGTVTVELSDGTAGRYDLVIGADGVHSTQMGAEHLPCQLPPTPRSPLMACPLLGS